MAETQQNGLPTPTSLFQVHKKQYLDPAREPTWKPEGNLPLTEQHRFLLASFHVKNAVTSDIGDRSTQ